MLKEELEIISQAILNEIEGYEFYKMAANQAGTIQSKDAFLELAKEELEHVEFLKALLRKIRDDKGDDLKSSLEVSPPSPEIYKWENVDQEYTSLAMAVFGIGMQMEVDSIRFYEEAKTRTKYEEAKKLFDLLIEWEKIHLEQFTKQYNKHKENWWADQSFAPF